MKHVLIAAAAAIAMTGGASAQGYMNDSRIKDCTDTKYSFESRIKACDKALVGLNLDPDAGNQVRAWALLYRSDAYASLLKYDEAIADADKAHELFPDERHILGAQCWSRAASNR
jgi:tetratricopeptide (TPR) repeat protein